MTLPRLVSHEVVVLSADPLVGVLQLETDLGGIEIAVNFEGADALREDMERFLSEDAD